MPVFRHPLACLLPFALLGAPFAALAARVLTPEDLRQMPAAEAKAYVLARVAEQASRRARAHAGADDLTPPVLTAFNAAAKAKAGGMLNASFSATDDMSGVLVFNAYAYNSTGGSISAGAYDNLPLTKQKGAASGSINPYASPGSYTFDWAYLYDVAGNYTYLAGADLAALGNTVVTVTNATGYDATPPALSSGKVLTPTVSLSATHPGTNQAAYAGVELQATDAGGNVVSGLAWAWANFCLPDGSTCFSVYGNSYPTGQSRSTVKLGAQPGNYSNLTVGTYQLVSVQLVDNAYNVQYLTSTEFGGETDFSLYFPSTTITLKP